MISPRSHKVNIPLGLQGFPKGCPPSPRLDLEPLQPGLREPLHPAHNLLLQHQALDSHPVPFPPNRSHLVSEFASESVTTAIPWFRLFSLPQILPYPSLPILTSVLKTLWIYLVGGAPPLHFWVPPLQLATSHPHALREPGPHFTPPGFLPPFLTWCSVCCPFQHG